MLLQDLTERDLFATRKLGELVPKFHSSDLMVAHEFLFRYFRKLSVKGDKKETLNEKSCRLLQIAEQDANSYSLCLFKYLFCYWISHKIHQCWWSLVSCGQQACWAIILSPSIPSNCLWEFQKLNTGKPHQPQSSLTNKPLIENRISHGCFWYKTPPRVGGTYTLKIQLVWLKILLSFTIYFRV